MPSSFAWLDYAGDDRQPTLDLIDLQREQDTLNELGIGTVRDVFSNLLFPGTSTIQIRAKQAIMLEGAEQLRANWDSRISNL